MIKSMLEVYKSIISSENIFYCSAPITSGKRFLDYIKDKKEKDIEPSSLDKESLILYKELVTEPNKLHAKSVILKLRQVTGKLVIDPTELSQIDGWTQNDWRLFWQRVIEQYVNTAIFVNDWQYSKGCVHEFLTAHHKGISTLNEDLDMIDLETGIKLITEAINLMNTIKIPTIHFRNTLQELEKVRLKNQSF